MVQNYIGSYSIRVLLSSWLKDNIESLHKKSYLGLTR